MEINLIYMHDNSLGKVETNHQEPKTHHTHSEHEYNNLKIPCDWEIARKHALARRTAPDTKDEDLNKKRNIVGSNSCI